MKPATHPTAVRFQAMLGAEFTVVEFEETCHTAADAAAAIGCDVAQIAKSLIFRAKTSARSVLVVTSGINRVDERKVSALLGEKVERADAEFVREMTGFAIGGIPPLGHRVAPVVFIDDDLFALGVLWAAAGTSHAVFSLTAAQLEALSGGVRADLAKR